MIKMKTLTIGGVTYEVVDAGLTENVVMHKEQNLTEEQKAQARENIGAAENGHGHTTDDISGLGSLATKSTVEKTDLSSDVQTSLGKADSALQSYTETDPTVPAWAKAATKPTYTAQEVGALPDTTVIPDISGLATEDYVDSAIAAIPTPDVSGQITTHNTSTAAHSDIRDLISGLTTRLNALADSDDTTLDQMSEIVAYIKSNKSLIEDVTTNKVNVSDIINDLTTNVANKPLSAAQGVVLKALIDAITVPTKVSELTNDKGYLTSYTETDPTVPSWAKASTKPSYTKSEVGLGNVDNVKQYSASNPPPYPVTSVNGKTGAVAVSAVPSCTTSNNGQFLRVVNGVAAWSTIPSAEEASF